MVISDYRRLRVSRISVHGGELALEQGVELWQDLDGVVHGVGLWADILVPKQEDLSYQANILNISPIELLKRRLGSLSYIKVETL